MARRRKSSNDPLTFLITAFLMIPFAIAAIFKLLFKGFSCLASFIGKCIERRQIKQQAYTYNTSSSYRAQSSYHPKCNSTASSNSSNSTYKARDNTSNQTSQRSHAQSTSQNTEQRNSTHNSNTHASSYSSLYEALRISGDPDPDLTIPSAPDYESYDEYFDDSNTVFEEIVPDEDDVLFEELENVDIDESDLTIMGLALYDMLTNEDNN